MCQPERRPDDVDELAALYDDELNSILDRTGINVPKIIKIGLFLTELFKK